MDAAPPQYYENTFVPVNLDKETLVSVLNGLRAAIRHGLDIVQNDCPPPAAENGFGTIFNGSLGIAYVPSSQGSGRLPGRRG